MKRLALLTVAFLSFNLAYSQDFKEISGDSITDLEFAQHFFEIDLPDNFKLEVDPNGFIVNYYPADPYSTTSVEKLTFEMAGINIVMEQDSSIDISVYSLRKVRWSDIPDSAKYAESIDISYYLEKDDWFVVSGIGKYSGDVLYIKVYFGEDKISRLRLQYAQDKKSLIEPYISRLSNSFKGY